MTDAITPLTIIVLAACGFLALLFVWSCLLVWFFGRLKAARRRRHGDPVALGMPPKSEQGASTEAWRASQPLRANEHVYNPSRHDPYIARRLGHLPTELERRNGTTDNDNDNN